MPASKAALALVLVLASVISVGCSGGEPSAPVLTPPPAPSAEGTATNDLAQLEIALTPIAGGLEQPVFLTHAGDGSGRLFVVEQSGRVRVIRDGTVQRGSFLDVRSLVSTGGERGLLGLAFPPDYTATGRFYVNYTDERGDTIVARFVAVDTGSDSPETTGPEVVLRVDQPYSNHNGGCIVFGPDGMLWVGMGDGGSGGDPQNRAQDPSSLLGKMLRLDVRGAGAARAPDDNHGVATGPPYAPEVHQSGLRNPWRFSFDRETQDLWIADVGQNAWEEINHVTIDGAAGANYGWRLWEGTHPYPEGSDQDRDAYVFPVSEYGRAEGQSVTGGYVYRGAAHPELRGVYFYADYVAGWVAGLRLPDEDALLKGERVEERVLATGAGSPTSFGEDESGELYLVDHNGTISRIDAQSR